MIAIQLGFYKNLNKEPPADETNTSRQLEIYILLILFVGEAFWIATRDEDSGYHAWKRLETKFKSNHGARKSALQSKLFSVKRV